MAVELPELAEGWHWNAIEENARGHNDKIAREYVVSASRSRGLPKYVSRTVYFNSAYDTSEEIRENFDMAFEAVAEATKKALPNQDRLDSLAEILDGFDDARVAIAFKNHFNKPSYLITYKGD